jgi:hypothetical protein
LKRVELLLLSTSAETLATIDSNGGPGGGDPSLFLRYGAVLRRSGAQVFTLGFGQSAYFVEVI